MRQRGSGTIPFLLFVGTLVVCVTVFYGLYLGTAENLEAELEALESVSKYAGGWTDNWQYGEGCVVPINDVDGLIAYYGENDYTNFQKKVLFEWSRLSDVDEDHIFTIEINHIYSQHDNDDVAITLSVTWKPEWKEGKHLAAGAVWYDEDTPCYIHVNKTRVRMTDPFPTPRRLFPINTQIHISEITRVRDPDNLVYGIVRLDFDTYETGVVGFLKGVAGTVAGWIKGAVGGIFGFIAGDAGKEFVDTLSGALTLNLPGIPTPIRLLLLVPMWMGIGFIIVKVVSGFMPTAGGVS